ncbi:MAG: hypothetical protein VYD19_04210, partial [Myxococcota bacterium]|nr:hypothetical protein [Myxococcota bacterium]
MSDFQIPEGLLGAPPERWYRLPSWCLIFLTICSWVYPADAAPLYLNDPPTRWGEAPKSVAEWRAHLDGMGRLRVENHGTLPVRLSVFGRAIPPLTVAAGAARELQFKRGSHDGALALALARWSLGDPAEGEGQQSPARLILLLPHDWAGGEGRLFSLDD